MKWQEYLSLVGEALQAHETKILFVEYREDKQQLGGKLKNQTVDCEGTEMDQRKRSSLRLTFLECTQGENVNGWPQFQK